MVKNLSFYSQKNLADLLIYLLDRPECKESDMVEVISNYYSITVATNRLLDLEMVTVKEESNGSRKARIYNLTPYGRNIGLRLKELDDEIKENEQ